MESQFYPVVSLPYFILNARGDFPETKLTCSLAAMNYVSAVYAVVFILIIGYWFLRGKHTFRSKDERAVEAEQFTQNLSVQ